MVEAPLERQGPPRARLTVVVAVVLVVTLGVGAVVFLREPTITSYGGEGLGGWTGSFPGAPATALHERWGVVAPSEAAVMGWIPPPAVDGDTVLVPADLGLVALDLATGGFRWRYELGSNGEGVVLAEGGPAIVSGWNVVAAVAPADGRELWRREVEGSISLAGVREGLAIGVRRPESDGAGLVALDVDDGTERWSATLGRDLAPHGARPLLTDEVVLVSTSLIRRSEEFVDGTTNTHEEWLGEGPVIAFALDDGRELWRREDVRVDGTGLGVTRGAVLVASPVEPAEVRALDDATGETLWTHRLEGRVLRPPFLASDGERVAVHIRSELTVLDASDGSVVATYETDGSGPLALAGDVAVVALAPTFVGIDLDDGREVWSHEWDRQIPHDVEQIDVHGDAVLVTGGRFTVLDRGTGEVRWTFNAGHGESCSLAVAEGFVVVNAPTGTSILDAATGEMWWRRPAEGGGWGYHSTRGLGVDEDGGVFELGPSGPSGGLALRGGGVAGQRWQVPMANWSRGLAVGEHVYVLEEVAPSPDGGERGRLVARDREDGDEVWTLELEGGSHRAPLAAGTHVLAFAEEDIVAVEAATGEVAWRLRGVEGPAVVAADDRLIVVGGSDGARALSTADGSTLWRWDRQDHRITGAVLARDVVVLTMEDELVAVVVGDGRHRWRVPLESRVHGGVAVAGDTIHLATVAGLELRRLDDGELIEQIPTDRLVVSRPLPVAGQMVVCLSDGSVRAYG